MTAAVAPLVLPPLTRGPAGATARRVVAHVTGGLDGALRVLTLLRGRGYRVRELGLDVREHAESRVTGTLVLTGAELDLLLARLRRLPAVVSAECG